MPARPWADAPRLRFLKQNLPAYEAAQERKKTRIFLGKLHDNYFAMFPEPNEKLLGIEKKRVSVWMNNHSGGRGHKNGGLKRATRVSFRELLRGKLEQKRRQKLQLIQAYSELYYERKWKSTIKAEWDAKLVNEPDLQKKDALAYRNMRLKQLFEDESDDVKTEVKHYRRASPQDESDLSPMLLPGEEDLDENEQSRRITARNIQSAIDNVETVMSEIAKDIEEVTGLTSHFVLAGPEPKRQGRMVMFTVTSGRTIGGNRSFKEHHPSYKAGVHDTFFSFAKACYSREVREKYANVPFPDTEDSSSAIVSSTDVPRPRSSTRKPTRTRKHTQEDDDGSSSDMSVDSDSEHGYNSDAFGTDGPDDTTHAVNESEMDIFSPHLPPDRRVVESKVDSGGLRLYKTAEGRWMSEAELHRMANIARNIQLMGELGLEGAKRQLATKPARQQDEETIVDDDREFTMSHTPATVTAREHHPRQSKANVSYTEKRDNSIDLGTTHLGSIPVSATCPPGSGGANSEVVEAGTGNHTITPVTENSTVVSTFAFAPPSSNVTPPVPSPANAIPMEVNDHASLVSPMAVDAVAGIPNAQTLKTPSLVSPIDIDLGTLDLSKVPAWLHLPLQHLREEFTGEMEDKILRAFVALEMAWQPFEKRIGTEGRPPAVAWWIKNARPINRVPPCIDLDSFPAQVRKWWSTIQPQWRVSVVGDWPLLRHEPAGEPWQEARLGGCNGVFLIVLCLYWWRHSAEMESNEVSLAEYASVAEDVVFVFEAILHSGVTNASRTPLTSSARANVRTGGIRKMVLQSAQEPTRGSRSLRSSAVKENIKSQRARRSCA